MQGPIISYTESQFEATTIERLRALGYQYQPASTLDRDLKSVVLAGRLRAHLARRYSHLPAKALDEAVAAARNPDGVTLDQRNMNFHQTLTRGYELKYEVAGQDCFEHIYFVDWDKPENNDFLVVNQLTVEGANTRRPDLVIYVNGLPLVVFELKSPRDEYAGVAGAYNQLQHYLHDIPRLFDFNAGCVLSDGVHTLQGMHSADFEWFTPWKSIDGQTVEPVIHGFLRSKAIGLGATVFALNGVEDHVHLVAAIPPKIAVAKFIGQVKAVASTKFNKAGLSDRPFFWPAEYGAFSFDELTLCQATNQRPSFIHFDHPCYNFGHGSQTPKMGVTAP